MMKKKDFILFLPAILLIGLCTASESGQEEKKSHQIQVVEDVQTITLVADGKKILSYYHALHNVPEGVDPLYRRSGFIHPLWSPDGQVLTRIQPPDHYHHYGIWGPWTLTHIEGREVDFWNLAKGQGTVRFAGLDNVLCTSEMGSFRVRQEHVDFTAAKEGRVSIEEILEVRARPEQAEGRPVWIIDLIRRQRNVLDVPIELNQYRYGGGLGYRATEQWTKENCTVMTSEGKTRKDADGQRARWCDVNGAFDNGRRAGIVFMSHPDNRQHPEPMRIWPEDAAGGRGDLFVKFCPIRLEGWTLEPGKQVELKYRLIVYDDTINPQTAEDLWTEYVQKTMHVLIYTRNGQGYVHDNIPASIECLRKICAEQNWTAETTDDASIFTPDRLRRFDVLIFSNTNNEAFDTEAQRRAFQRYMQNGGGFVGIHSACGSERNWPWFWANLGGKFVRHPPLQPFDIKVIDKNHPSTSHLEDIWKWEDECYYMNELNPDIHVLLAVDLQTIRDEGRDEYPGRIFGDLFPLCWCHQFEGGRQWYTALGHKIEHYEDENFIRHLAGGIEWVLNQQKP